MKRLQLKALPELQSSAHMAWREGWFQGIAVGIVIGVGLALVFLHR